MSRHTSPYVDIVDVARSMSHKNSNSTSTVKQQAIKEEALQLLINFPIQLSLKDVSVSINSGGLVSGVGQKNMFTFCLWSESLTS